MKTTSRRIAARHLHTKPSRAWTTRLGLVLCAALAGTTTWAATLTVNDAADTVSASTCTLRSAVQAMNTATLAGTGCTNTGAAFGSADRIEMGPAIDVINLSDTPDNDILITVPSLTIAGRVGSTTTIAGPVPSGRVNFFRVLTHVASGGGGALTLQRLIIGLGAVNSSSLRSGGGGGVSSLGHVTLENSLISNNTTNCTGCHGGGVLALGDLSISNSTFDSNGTQGASSAGGAAAAFGSLTSINNASFALNTTQGANSLGGALHLQTTTSNIQSSFFASNHTSGADAFGGAFYATGALELTNAYVVNNHAKGQGGGGMTTGSAIIRDSSFIENSVTNYVPATNTARGGALSLFGSPNSVTNSTFNRNSATSSAANAGLGGALWVRTYLDIANSTLFANVTTGRGGGIFFNDLGITAIFNSTIVAGSTSQSVSTPPDMDIDNNVDSSATVTGANNLIQKANNIAVPMGTLTAAPLLAPRADNGCATPAGAPLTGPTFMVCPATLLPQAGSPAINAGNNLRGLATDQRGAGFVRVSGGTADIGAVETSLTVVGTPTAVPTLSTWAFFLLAGLLTLPVALQRARKLPPG